MINRDYAVVFATLYVFSMGLVINIVSDLTYMWIDPRIDPGKPGGLTMDVSSAWRPCRPSIAADGRTSRLTGAAGGLPDLRRCLWRRCFPTSSPNDRPLVVSYKGELLFLVLVDYPEEKFGGFLAITNYRGPLQSRRDREERLMITPSATPSTRPTPRHRSPVPSPPAFLLTPEQCCSAYPQGVGDRDQVFGNMNWVSAPTTRAATSSPAPSTASASRCCSA